MTLEPEGVGSPCLLCGLLHRAPGRSGGGHDASRASPDRSGCDGPRRWGNDAADAGNAGRSSFPLVKAGLCAPAFWLASGLHPDRDAAGPASTPGCGNDAGQNAGPSPSGLTCGNSLGSCIPAFPASCPPLLGPPGSTRRVSGGARCHRTCGIPPVPRSSLRTVHPSCRNVGAWRVSTAVSERALAGQPLGSARSERLAVFVIRADEGYQLGSGTNKLTEHAGAQRHQHGVGAGRVLGQLGAQPQIGG